MTKKKTKIASKKNKSAESVQKTPKRPKKQKKNVFRFFFSFPGRKALFRFVLAAGVILSLAVGGYVTYCALTLPDIRKAAGTPRAPRITVLASDGTEIASYGAQYDRPVRLDELPPHVYQAVIATEDVRFFNHIGIDFRAIARAFFANIVKGRKAQGASTITQQVAKNLFLSSEKTIRRKVQEILLSFWLERNLSKEQILTIYLNRVYLGAGTYGIEAAARRYYGIQAKDLNLYQAAVIAALLKAPTHYNPLVHPEASVKRARLVLAKMARAGFISAREGLGAAETGAVAGAHRNKSALYFADWIADELEAYIGSFSQDVTVVTTLSPRLQKHTDAVIAETLDSPEARKKNVTQAAAVIMEHDGAVLALSGGRDYARSQFNRATEARRQIGSTVKPFVYLAAFERGASPEDVVEDRPLNLNGWQPGNAGGKYYGRITLADALTKSVNTVAVSTALKTGVRRVLKTARKFGAVGEDCEANGAIALGVCQTRLIDVVAGYAALANGGYGVNPYGISEILGADGSILYQRSSQGRSRLANPRDIARLDAVLIDVIQNGTGKKANPGLLAKGKTGTTQNYRDAWFVGYTQDIAAGVWVGNDDESPMDKVGGGSFPAEMWGKIVRATAPVTIHTADNGLAGRRQWRTDPY